MANANDMIVPHLVHSHDVTVDAEYTRWLVELKERYRSAQIKAAVKVNAEKLLFNCATQKSYWTWLIKHERRCWS